MARTLSSIAGAVARRIRLALRWQERTVRWGQCLAVPREPVAGPPGLAIRRVTPEDLPLLEQVGPIDRDAILERLARGDWGYLGLLDGRGAACLWVQRSGEHEVTQAGRRYVLRPGENVIYNARTAEAARGRGAYQALVAFALRELFAAGHRAVWVYANSDNAASLRGLEKAGFRFAWSWRALQVSYWTIPLGTGERPPEPPA